MFTPTLSTFHNVYWCLPLFIHVSQRLLISILISIHVLQRLIVLTLIYLHFTRLLFTRSLLRVTLFTPYIRDAWWALQGSIAQYWVV